MFSVQHRVGSWIFLRGQIKSGVFFIGLLRHTVRDIIIFTTLVKIQRGRVLQHLEELATQDNCLNREQKGSLGNKGLVFQCRERTCSVRVSQTIKTSDYSMEERKFINMHSSRHYMFEELIRNERTAEGTCSQYVPFSPTQHYSLIFHDRQSSDGHESNGESAAYNEVFEGLPQ
ncbi:hypothetical protein HELRODRAFT_182823 [Helobdella robusta]|uniref:Uncharacterized protein n=1 Tax=Helobdella robusta TaxID=6412 RepID=T1FIT2_HELRO|nr:hypothetical protein HELRODRAFT_182823 [Helobdella robusta]ESN90126.1 hypothetical protein HELRODRAFT_182823 [Helobdella robusta]